MLSQKNLEQLAKSNQTTFDNIVREYFQHLFLSYFYQNPNSEKILFKGGTALRIVFGSPRFSEDLDFTGVGILNSKIETILMNTLANLKNTGLKVEISENKPTTGGYLSIAYLSAYNLKLSIQIEISFRQKNNKTKGTRALIANNFAPAYTLVHLPTAEMIEGKLAALFNRHKPRDFYDYYFLLSGNFQIARNKETLNKVLQLLNKTEINFRSELKKFLPASHSLYLKNFKEVLRQKINNYL